ncbi:hypothetical protein DFS33DRAFT_1330210 [Desarmillaria ectypa]|nr:hypothetical protein DFS33DRAFT_1330210 [Desarmillaria ectypa]
MESDAGLSTNIRSFLLNEVVLSFEQRNEDEYLLPDWYPEEDVNQRNVKRAVRMSNVTSFDVARTIRSWIRDFEESGPHHVLFYSLYPKKVYVFSSVSARKFVERYMSAVQGIGAQMSLKPQRKPLPRSKITAVDLGASIVLGFACTVANDAVFKSVTWPSTVVGIPNYPKNSAGASYGWVFLTFNSVNNALKCIVGFERDETDRV